MTKPLIELPSVREKRLMAEIDNLKNKAADKDVTINDWMNRTAALKAELNQLKELMTQKINTDI